MPYVYPVVFSPLDQGGYCVYAPDFKGCITEATDYADGILKIRDGLCGMLYIMERDKMDVPEPTHIDQTPRGPGDIVTLVDAPLEEYRRRVGSKAVRRTISIPEWLDKLAVKNEISLSQITQRALKSELRIHD
ncbi:MAG: type II toxin-antitoxin system HicB family antitoxin [Clostridiales bacterium]|jgi:predicted RNase H-like HicB family nuclease|nr:type II toxin-antitoxin system HicB family antitoxin [Clostridiales bacterium]